MKVIGKIDANKYICEVSHTEIEKAVGKYYGKLPQLRVGQCLNLASGYNYHRDIMSALKKTKEFIEAHDNIIRAIMNGLQLVNYKDEKSADEE